ncbi:MAG: hypothetical protein AB1643_01820 [Patescibacteria group bacterium]
MENLLINFSETHRIIAYIIIFLGVFLEGEFVLILGGILSRNGYLDILDLVIFSFLAVAIHDIVYWHIGSHLAKTNKKRFLFINLEKLENLLEKLKINSGLYIFISKFTWNFNRIVLMASGYIKTPLKKMFIYSLPANFIWSITFVSLGYIFAFKTDILKQEIKKALLILTVFIVVFIILEIILRAIIGNLFNKNNDK